MTEPTSAQDLFKGRHFDQEIIILCVRWYLALPEFEKRWSRYARPVGDSWRVDETYLKIRGQWVYLYPWIKRAAPSTSS